MKISNLTSQLSQVFNNQNGNIDQEFSEILKTELRNARIESEMQDKLEDFKSQLSNLGAFGYLTTLNEQKIDEKIAQKRAELEEILGLNGEKSDDEKAKISSLISNFLSEYRYKLEEQSRQNNTIDEKQNGLNKIGSFVNIADLLSKV